MSKRRDGLETTDMEEPWTVVQRGRTRHRPRTNYSPDDLPERQRPYTYADAVRSSHPSKQRYRMETRHPRSRDGPYPRHTNTYYDQEDNDIRRREVQQPRRGQNPQPRSHPKHQYHDRTEGEDDLRGAGYNLPYSRRTYPHSERRKTEKWHKTHSENHHTRRPNHYDKRRATETRRQMPLSDDSDDEDTEQETRRRLPYSRNHHGYREREPEMRRRALHFEDQYNDRRREPEFRRRMPYSDGHFNDGRRGRETGRRMPYVEDHHVHHPTAFYPRRERESETDRPIPHQYRRETRPTTQQAAPHSEETDPNIGPQIKKMFHLIRLIHHFDNISFDKNKESGNYPITFKKITHYLKQVIKPAAITEKTRELLDENALNWTQNTQIILEEHYKTAIENTIKELDEILSPEWNTALEVAKRWAKRKFGKRLTEETLEVAEAHIVSSLRLIGRPGRKDNQNQKSQTTNQPTTMLEETEQEVETQVLPLTTDMATSPIQNSAWPPLRILTPTTEGPKDQRPPRRNKQPNVRSEIDSTIILDPPVSREQTPSQNRNQLKPPESIQLEESIIQKTALIHTTEEDDRMEEEEDTDSILGEEDIDSAQPIEDDYSTCGEEREKEEEWSTHEQENQEEAEVTITEPPESDVTINPIKQKPTRHLISKQKMINWKLKVKNTTILIGDSNLSRIPEYDVPELQIDSYPGATFRHIGGILEKLEPNPKVEKVIMSIGINNRNQSAKTTAIKQLQTAMRITRNAFPKAKIWIPVINFSQDLPQEEKDSLQQINRYIVDNVPNIPPLPERDFKTTRGDIHWTPETARAMLTHWCRRLNSEAH